MSDIPIKEEMHLSKFLREATSKTRGKTDQGFFEQKKSQSNTSLRLSKIALVEFDGFCVEKYQESRQEILADLQTLAEKNSIVDSVKTILQGFANHCLAEHPCNSCENGMIQKTNKKKNQCQACHGTMRKKALAINTYKNYNQQLRDYLRYHGVLRNVNEKELKVIIPKEIKEEKEALETPLLKKIIQTAIKKQLLYQFMAMSGCRIGEALQLIPKDFVFVDENGMKTSRKEYHRIKISIRGEIAKTRQSRHTFLHREIEDQILEVIDKKKSNEPIFGNETHIQYQVTREGAGFQELRDRMVKQGVKELADKYLTGISKVTLHTLRSWFVSQTNKVDFGFGHALAGHELYMKNYNRHTKKEMLDLWKKAEIKMALFEQVSENEVVTELKNQLEETQKELQELKKQNKDISDIFKDVFDDDDPPTPNAKPRPRGKQ